jgi:hypothetical protein
MVPEFIDPVFTKTSPKRSFSLNRKRAFWLVFAKTGSIISGTEIGKIEAKKKNWIKVKRTDAVFLKLLCPFAEYYLRYAVRAFFTLSRISAKERDKKYSVKWPQRYKM